MSDVREYAFKWFHGVALVVLVMFVNTFFGFFGLTLTLATLGTAVASYSALAFVLLAFILLPIIYGTVSAKLSEWLGEGDFPSNIDLEEVVRFWMHGLVLTVAMLLVTTVFGVFGIAFSFAMLSSALDGFKALIIVIIGFVAVPFTLGWISDGLTELLH